LFQRKKYVFFFSSLFVVVQLTALFEENDEDVWVGWLQGGDVGKGQTKLFTNVNACQDRDLMCKVFTANYETWTDSELNTSMLATLRSESTVLHN